jgi:hypothetical protein
MKASDIIGNAFVKNAIFNAASSRLELHHLLVAPAAVLAVWHAGCRF